MAITLYGIPNCDTVKRARAWLTERGIEHRFHDFKKSGVPLDALDAALAQLGWDRLLNRRGTAWRALPEALKASIARLLSYGPDYMYLTHYGRIGDVGRLALELYTQIDAMTTIARAADGHDDRHARLVDALGTYYLERAHKHGCLLDGARVREVIGLDIELNAQGLASWLDRDRR